MDLSESLTNVSTVSQIPDLVKTHLVVPDFIDAIAFNSRVREASPAGDSLLVF
jgi:hypothetical protein